MAADFPNPEKVARLRDEFGRFVSAAKLAEDALKGVDTAAEIAARKQEKLAAATEKAAKSSKKQAAAAKAASEEFDYSKISLSGALDALKATGPEGYAVALGLQAATIGALGLVAALTGLAIAAYNVTDQRGDWVTLFDALGKGPGAGEAILAQVDALAKELPFATSKIADWAKSMLAAGVKAEDLEASVKAVASATALMGEAGGAAAEKMIKQLAEGGAAADKMIKSIQEGGPKSARLLAEMGLHVEDVATAMGMTVDQFQKAKIGGEEMRKAVEKALQQKGAGALANMLMDMPVILMKVKEGFFSVFENLGKPMDAAMTAVQKLFSHFYKGSSTIKVLQGVVTTVFTFLLTYATKAINAIAGSAGKVGGALQAIWKFFAPVAAILVAGVKSIVVVFTFLYGVMKPIIGILAKIYSNATVLTGIQTIFKFIAGAIVVVVVILAVLASAFAAVIGVIGAFVGAVYGVAAGIVGEFTEAVFTVIGLISELVGAFTGAGGSITDGLVNGIDPAAFIAKMAEMAAGGLAAFKAKLLIGSPSKVMEQMGGFVAQGTEQGLDKGSSGVEASASELGASVVGGAAKGMSGGKAGGAKGSVTINVAPGALVINASGATVTDEGFALALERFAASIGLSPEPA